MRAQLKSKAHILFHGFGSLNVVSPHSPAVTFFAAAASSLMRSRLFNLSEPYTDAIRPEANAV
jgi:hypothetical protein